MAAYQTIVVGTDGSDSSFRAVDRAAAIAADTGAALVIASAYHPSREVAPRLQDPLGADVAYQVVGSSPAEQAVRTAAERARFAGATKLDTVVVDGEPVPTLVRLVGEHAADLRGRQPRVEHAGRAHPRFGAAKWPARPAWTCWSCTRRDPVSGSRISCWAGPRKYTRTEVSELAGVPSSAPTGCGTRWGFHVGDDVGVFTDRDLAAAIADGWSRPGSPIRRRPPRWPG